MSEGTGILLTPRGFFGCALFAGFWLVSSAAMLWGMYGILSNLGVLP